MTEKRADRQPTDQPWDREEWAGDLSEDRAPGDADADRWNKTEWVGDQGEGAPLPEDPAMMPEGDTSISGRRQTSGEQHWGQGNVLREAEEETRTDR